MKLSKFSHSSTILIAKLVFLIFFLFRYLKISSFLLDVGSLKEEINSLVNEIFLTTKLSTNNSSKRSILSILACIISNSISFSDSKIHIFSLHYSRLNFFDSSEGKPSMFFLSLSIKTAHFFFKFSLFSFIENNLM